MSNTETLTVTTPACWLQTLRAADSRDLLGGPERAPKCCVQVTTEPPGELSQTQITNLPTVQDRNVTPVPRGLGVFYTA